MLNILLILALGAVFTYIAQDNLTPVTLQIGKYILSDIPLFYVIIGSLGIGLSLSYVMQLIRSFSTSLILRNKNKTIKQGTDNVLELTKRVHQLELENEKLKYKSVEPSDANAL